MSVLAGWESARSAPGSTRGSTRGSTLGSTRGSALRSVLGSASGQALGTSPLPEGPSRVAPPRRRAVRRPAGLTAAAPVRQPVVSCTPNYVRRRLVALLVVGLVTAAAVVALGMLAGAAAGDGVPERTAVVEVRQGESLWELAERVAPDSQPQAVVERIRELNGMHGSTVHPGQPLLVPQAG